MLKNPLKLFVLYQSKQFSKKALFSQTFSNFIFSKILKWSSLQKEEMSKILKQATYRKSSNVIFLKNSQKWFFPQKETHLRKIIAENDSQNHLKSSQKLLVLYQNNNFSRKSNIINFHCPRKFSNMALFPQKGQFEKNNCREKV